MSYDTSHTNDFVTASSRGGYFPGILLPPFVVILVGLLLALVSGGILVDQSVNAASFAENSEGVTSGNPQAVLDPDSVNFPGGVNSIGENELAPLFTPEVHYWGERIIEWSILFNIDPNLIATVMQIESCGFPLARSSAGAMGLFQVMPFHFENSENPYDIEWNAFRGLNYLKSSLAAASGDVSLALAGYNGGISVINLSSANWVDETQRYVYWGSGIYEEAIQGKDSSQRLEEWLSHGGASLCLQASINLGLKP
ncbi:lytic transglycosylase domain-containing protein [Chloroflexota bacterium]